jgi:hypothetical protein
MNNDNTVDLLQIKIEQAKEKLPAETLNAIAAIDWKAAIMGIRQKKGYNFEQLGALEIETELLLCGLVSSNDYPKEVQRRMNISRAETDDIINEMNMSVFRKIKEELIKNTERKKIFEQKKKEEQTPESEKTTYTPINKVETPISIGVHRDDGEVLKSAGIEVVKNEPVNTNSNIGEESREDLLKKIEHPASTRIIEPTQGGPSPYSIVELVQDEVKMPRMGDMRTILQDKILGSVKVPVVKTEHFIENKLNTNTAIVKAPDILETSHASKKDPYRMSPDE